MSITLGRIGVATAAGGDGTSFDDPHTIDRQGRYQPTRDYAVDSAGREVYVQNGGLHSHGLSNPELGLACHRNSCLIRELTGVEHYPIETGFALQSFGVPRSALFTPLTPPAPITKDPVCA